MMISTPAAPNQLPHLNRPLHASFKDHVRHRRRISQPMFPPARRVPSEGNQGDYGFPQSNFPGFRQQSLHPTLDTPSRSPGEEQLPPAALEHMLRRKTPNGTLKGGYDATPVGWASQPPAQKQQVRASSRDERVHNTPSSHLQSCVLLNGPDAHPTRFTSMQCPTANGPRSWSAADVYSFSLIPPFHQTGLSQSMDSLLYQGPPMNPASPFCLASNTPIALQPTWPRNIEPTASGPPMPYGPYWPNGVFEPYRPAAIRDARFNSQFAQINLNDPTDSPIWSRPSSENKTDLMLRDSIYLGPSSLRSVPYSGAVHLPQQQQQQQQQQQNGFDAYQTINSFGGYSQSYMGPPLQDSQEPTQQFPRQYRGNAPPNAGPKSLHFKEMAFVQALRSYTMLISFAQRTRKQQQSKSGQKTFSGASLFPKPPKSAYGLVSTAAHARPELGSSVQSRLPWASYHPRQGSNGATKPVPVMIQEAQNALDLLRELVRESSWTWTDAMLLGGCLAYGLSNLSEAVQWFQRVLQREPANVEAMSNLAAAFMTMNRRTEAEHLWAEAVKLRPACFEAVEHLVGLLCLEQRSPDAVRVIDHVEKALRGDLGMPSGRASERRLSRERDDAMPSLPCTDSQAFRGSKLPTDSHCPPSERGRLIALIHAKGNMLYAAGNITGAAEAFEEAIMIAVGRAGRNITGLIQRILTCFTNEIQRHKQADERDSPWDAILLLPKTAILTAALVFPNSNPLPGLAGLHDGSPKKAAIAITSNCLLSLAKIYQDSMTSGNTAMGQPSGASGVQDILALYYLSMSLQPSPSTANNVGILLAGIQQAAPRHLPAHLAASALPDLPGVVPGSGIALALAYYQYGLQLDSQHAHLYTNLGSLLKDLNLLDFAIKMYEEAVRCDGKFDIALANLANAVKDRGRISEAIKYYRRAVDANGDFAEAVCGLANALNSVCGWSGRGGIVFENRRFDRWHVDKDGMLVDARDAPAKGSGWIGRVVEIVIRQLKDGRSWGKNAASQHDYLLLSDSAASKDSTGSRRHYEQIVSWMGKDHEGAKIVRWVERATKRIAWQWYQDLYIHREKKPLDTYCRPRLPSTLSTTPNAPTVLPFHTFTCPLDATQIRQISQRNGLRISASTLRAPWLPAHVFKPPPPPKQRINIGYVSSDFNNHPLAHLMQSVFGMHDSAKYKAFCYATTPSDKSIHRQKIEKEAPVFHDVSSWPVDRLITQIVKDEIHILVNLNGYTRGARNEVFAARPAPIQMSFMGFAGTLGAEWCDYLLADDIAVPPSTLRPYRANVSLDDAIVDGNFEEKHKDWVFGENIIYTKHTFFCCDHRQSASDANEEQLTWRDELLRRRVMRKELFPELNEDYVILGNFNQLYKIEPTTFRSWLRILQAVPKAVLWLLRFPDLGETHLRSMAEKWATPDVAKRIIFTDVAPKTEHIARARVCDLFLDTPECNAHTTAADVLWSGTPLLTYPRYNFKMCSRMAASILKGAMPLSTAGAEAAKELTVANDEQYEATAIRLARGLNSVLSGNRDTCRLLEMRRLIYEGRWTSPLFDTRRWTRDLEKAYELAWDRWVEGKSGDIWL